ncbi:FUSC family protein [Pseudomonas granadensis]|uniref:FUSC family protein n=1 Tax=Pseudomonas granadensis TaxID=1421430 RepID=UPI0019D22F93|nr:FUSC family protein [Pseudomonas granadensis]MBN6774330.1 FUSC family protein [Pseudomonas granadensis]MBN6805196.1 FUSC family protein [Pseudomonas granadensis]MBN6832356.1 FUSC family protein [Pseudomonas granadensis]MBN6839390.1 FUSC family protein [Pseudomonas granadensis]MBN6868779.1 FUSC family protein [Pseudomonas granadensis]
MQALFNYFKAVIHPGQAVLLFALRTIAAGLLTLYLAFVFDLDQPKWSIMAVVIVSQPLAGMALARSFGQVIGTTLGAAVAVLIMAIFPQAPLPFITTLALWLALCTAGGTLLRYTSSQAFVLSGYTAVVVALLAIPDPDGTFLLAVTRVTETLLAVACVCVVSLLTARPQAVATGYFAKVDQVIKLAASHAAAVLRTEESEADFQRRQQQLLGEISALEGLRRHLYFDAPRLRSANNLVLLLGNQLMLLTSRLTALRHQRELLTERWEGDLPLEVQRLRSEELALLDELAEQGRSLSSERRHDFVTLQQQFEGLAYQAEQLTETMSATLRSLAWALRWEQARLLQQLNQILELSDAIQEGREASVLFRGQVSPLHLDFTLASMNAIRAFTALLVAGLIWIETAWDGARGGMILVGILCSLMATFPRPLMAAQSYARGLGLALVVSALYQFMLVPAISDFEPLALLLAPLLYVIAIGLANPATTGIAMGLGLSSFLMIGPQNVGTGQNTAIQWFEFAGAYVSAAMLALLVYAWIFPFRPALRLRRLYNEAREQVYALSKTPATDAEQFAFESRMVDRLTSMLGLLPAANSRAMQQLYEVSLACVALGVAMQQLRQQARNNALLSEAFNQHLASALRKAGRFVAGREDVQLAPLLTTLRALGDELDDLHVASHEHLWSVFRMRVALLIIVSFLQRHGEFIERSIPEGEPALAH